ncbi:hypothetical protein C8P66_110129 [Humitalea rosea]|uniref:Uncharacterized protein n=1 Tax=Humitalea rosea TaxID=990373 RepID=A0A2W7IGP3_9PROT|nr:hypothetical protein [Humitalea rosea]PZW45931.1 hypothetical protein C8P66_110129 [Humitalea rosea]
MERNGALIRDSVTELGAEARGQVALCASHGGGYAAAYAAARGVAGLLLHDAGIGRERAGVAGLEGLTIPAAACTGAPIGDGAALLAEGRLSVVNAAAAALGLHPGMGCGPALDRLLAAYLPPAPPAPPMEEARHLLRAGVWGLDSNSLVKPSDAGSIIVTGSHCALLGGRAATAVKADVRVAIYNDAGSATTRLPALDARGIAGAAVSCFSARIGEALSTWNDGFISAVNDTAAAAGGRIGQTCQDFVSLFLDRKP